MSAVDVYLPSGRGAHKKRRFYFIVIIIVATVYFIIVVVGWFVLRAPFFRIASIEVSGNEEVSSGRIRSVIISGLIRGNFLRALLGVNNILLWPKEIGEDGLFFLPEVKSVVIKKDYRKGTVSIIVEERAPRGIWCSLGTRISADEETQIVADTISVNQRANQRTSAVAAGDECWWFDEEGIIFKRGIFAEGSLITVVSDYSQSELGLRSKILPEAFIGNAFSVFDALRKSGLGIKAIRLNDLGLEEVEVLTFDGPRILLSLRFPATNPLEVINNLSAKSGFRNLEYLDFRVENRVYYK